MTNLIICFKIKCSNERQNIQEDPKTKLNKNERRKFSFEKNFEDVKKETCRVFFKRRILGLQKKLKEDNEVISKIDGDEMILLIQKQ